MAIQMRRGLRKDFDPNKMLPGEWAVSIDSSTSNQIVWMCFATGVCKRMGTYEDFQNMVYQATGEIIERYEENFGKILAEVKEVANDVKSDKEEVIYIKSEITDTYLPQIRQYISSASSSANSASADAVKAKASADAAKASEQNAKKSEEKAKTYADNASAVTGVQIATKEIAGLVKGGDNLIDEDGTLTLTKSTTERTLTNSYAGGIKINEICGASEQYSGTITDEEGNEIAVPSPDYPQEIKSVEVSEVKVVGKNLVKNTITSKTFSGITLTVNNDKSFALRGTTTKSENYQRLGRVALQPGTYKLSGTPRDSGIKHAYLFVNNENSVAIAEDMGNGATFTIKKKEMLSLFLTIKFADTTLDYVYKPMIQSIDVEDTEYTPYQESIIKLSEPITLNGIGDTKDRIVRKDGVWGVERNTTYTRILTPKSKTWNQTGTAVDRYFVEVSYLVDDIGDASAQVLCTHFIDSSTAEIVGEMVFNQYGYIGFAFAEKGTSTVEEFAQFLEDNEVYALAVKATPTFEPLPESDQIALNSLVSFNTVTHIITDSGIEPIIEVEYGTSKVGAYTLDAWNTAKRNEIKNAQIEALITELATNTVAESEE